MKKTLPLLFAFALLLTGCESAMSPEKLQAAAAEGQPRAQYVLGYNNFYAVNRPQDRKEAVRLWRLSAAAGNNDAAYMLAKCYAKGDGVWKNSYKAYFWFTREGVDSRMVANEDFDLRNAAAESITQAQRNRIAGEDRAFFELRN